MSEAKIRDLFEKLSVAQRELDLIPDTANLSTFQTYSAKEHDIMHAIVLELCMPKVVEKLKVASAAAQAAHAKFRAKEINLDERNVAVKAAVDARDEMVTLLNDQVQNHLFEYNCLKRRPDLVAEFGIREASTLCAAS
jgi:hypothetical protein